MDIYRMFFLTTLFIHDSVLQLLLLAVFSHGAYQGEPLKFGLVAHTASNEAAVEQARSAYARADIHGARLAADA